jgi:heavy metal efflux system protein
MLRNLIHWAVNARLVVCLCALSLLAAGTYAFLNVNVEAYPDPAPAIVEVLAQHQGASAEEVERLVTVPIEVALAGMPGLTSMRSESMFQLCHVRCQFEYGVTYLAARQEVINRLRLAELPEDVTPVISPSSPTGEIMRYVLHNPRDALGRPIYTLNDMKSLQDFTLERRFRRVPRIADVGSYGGTTKRYEIVPDPDRMQRYGITLQVLEDAVQNSNANVGAQYLSTGGTVEVVRSLGLIGYGQDPIEQAMGMSTPEEARDFLRAEEQRRLREIRQIVITSVNNVPIRVDDIVDGGPLQPEDDVGAQGVVVSHLSRLGRVMFAEPQTDAAGRELLDEHGDRVWNTDDDLVQGIVLLRKGEESLPALKDVEALVEELNSTPGRLLPGVQIEAFYDRTKLIHMTTDTVRENLIVGMVLVTVILLMFLSNVRSAVIVAINVPLAVLFAFGVIFLRGESANLLSIGAVDIGIIVDSSVIMVENIYRHLSQGVNADLPLKERVQHAANEIQKPLLYSTLIMVCGFIPLFTMEGPEGQIFKPMAHTYAFALGGALLLAVVLSPVLCELALGNVKPRPDNLLVRLLQRGYLTSLRWCLKHRWLFLGGAAAVVALVVACLPRLGREFMPQLEEGNIYVRGTFPLNASLDEVTERTRSALEIMKQYPETVCVAAQIGRPDDGTDPTGFYNVEFFIPLKPHDDWPHAPGLGRSRLKAELVQEMNNQLDRNLVGVSWNFSQNIRDNVLEAMSGVKGENSVKIIGPDLERLEDQAEQMMVTLDQVPGIENAGIFRILGQSNLDFPVDRNKCSLWNVSVEAVQDVIETAVGGRSLTRMVEGERTFDVTVRFPERLRNTEAAILDIPVDVQSNIVTSSDRPVVRSSIITGPGSGPAPIGTSVTPPALLGSETADALNDLTRTPRRRIVDLVTPLGRDGRPDPLGSFVQPGASTVWREQGNRFIAIKFDVRGRDLASAVDDAQTRTANVIKPPFRVEWAGEFQEMQAAQQRLMLVIPLSFALIVVLLYLAFKSLIDVAIVLGNILALFCGGILALLLTGTNFSISAAVGFVSIFGVGIMNGLILVSTYHRLRLEGHEIEDAILIGGERRIRAAMMTILTPIFGLLPAALSTRIGAQSQQPLAIVVIGGMLMSLLFSLQFTAVLYRVFRTRPPDPESAGLAE